MSRVGLLLGMGLVVGLSVGCASRERVPLGEVEPRTDSTPIVDRYARARLILLDEINADRAEHGAAPVALDSLATVVAQQHADAMAKEGYLSHYESDGSAPYERFGEAGGVAHVRENVFRWSRRPSDPHDRSWAWPEFDIREAERWFMGSPGHRATILDPSRTHVGIGVAEDRERGAVFVVQEFIARHAWIDAPQVAWSRAPTTIRGRMLGAGTRPLLLFVSREPDVEPWWATSRRAGRTWTGATRECWCRRGTSRGTGATGRSRCTWTPRRWAGRGGITGSCTWRRRSGCGRRWGSGG